MRLMASVMIVCGLIITGGFATSPVLWTGNGIANVSILVFVALGVMMTGAGIWQLIRPMGGGDTAE